jgi:hypothetical protein
MLQQAGRHSCMHACMHTGQDRTSTAGNRSRVGRERTHATSSCASMLQSCTGRELRPSMKSRRITHDQHACDSCGCILQQSFQLFHVHIRNPTPRYHNSRCVGNSLLRGVWACCWLMISAGCSETVTRGGCCTAALVNH